MRKSILQVACLFALSALFLMGQAVSGTLSGKITAASGAAVPNAAITITDVNTNVSQKVLTGPDGSFSVAGLAPGTYRVDVETAGYKRSSLQNIELTTTGPAAVNITLESGNVSETVEIQATAPAVQSQNGEVSVGIGTRTLRELPVIDRNHQELVGLQTGITPPQTAIDQLRDPDRNRFFSGIGQFPALNLWQMDGVTNLEPWRGAAIRVQPVETIQQMNVVHANPTPERGFYGGAQVTNITRGGTNGWHGSLFGFHSNEDLRSRGFFSGQTEKPNFVYNQFGATAGGAIVPDSTFLFASYEGTYNRGSNTQISTVPVPGALTGNFSGVPGVVVYNPFSGTASGIGRTPFPGNRIPANFINPTAAAIANSFPAPNQPGFFNNYVSNVPYLNDGNKFDGRLDQRMGERTSAFVRYGYSNLLSHQNSPLGDVIGSVAGNRVVGQNAVANLAHEFGARLVSDFRFGYNRYTTNLRSFANQNELGFSSLQSNPLIGINIPGLPAIGTPADVPMYGVDNTYNFATGWNLHTSAHNVKWGVDIREYRSTGFMDPVFGSAGTSFFGPGITMLSGGPGLSQFGGVYNSWASFLLGQPTQVGVTNNFLTPSVRQTQYAAWLGDTMNLGGRLTLDLGVRYEIYRPLTAGSNNVAQFFNPADNTFSYSGIDGVGTRAWRTDLDNIAPRIGLALRATNRTVIRGGYAINYFQTPFRYSGFMGAPVYGAAVGVQGGFAAAPFQGQFGPTVSANVNAPATLQNGAFAGNLPANVLDRNFETPYVQTFSLQAQQDFYYGTMLSVGYVGSLGRHLPYNYEMNAAAPGMGVAGLPLIGTGRTASTRFYTSGLNNNYNSLQASLTRRFAQGLSFVGSYTWSKALGYTNSEGQLLNPFDLRANYGPQDYDRQHVLSISHLWELPFLRNGTNLVSTILGGWQLNGVFTWQTGTPLTITADPISCACPGNLVLASLNGPINFGEGANFFSPGGFSAPGFGQFGNLGRGAIRGPDTWNYNMSLFKSFRVRDRFNLELRGEAYNLSNSTQWANPITNLNSPGFGQITSTATGTYGRQFNLGARILF